MNAKLMQRANGSARLSEVPASCVAASVDYLNADLEQRYIEKEWGYFLPLPPKLLALDSAFFEGGDDHQSARYLIVTHDADGNPRPELSRTRYDTKHKDLRYHNPRGTGAVIYAPLPESFSQFEQADEKYIGEGEFKTMALSGAGCVALGIGGVWNWIRDGKLHPDLAKRIKSGQRIHLCIDGDWRTNSDVHKGTYKLMQAIRDVGGMPLLVVLPDIPGLGKVGIDDLIKTWRQAGRKNVAASLAALERLEEISNPFVVDLARPLDTAENFITLNYLHNDGPTLLHWQGEFYKWNGIGWAIYAEELLIRELYDFVRSHGSIPKQSNVTATLHALRAAAQSSLPEAPAWLCENELDATEMVAVANGLLHIPTLRLIPATPKFFNLNWSAVPFLPKEKCPRWLQFLGEVYPNDAGARDCLQEFMGYCLTEDTSQQKAIALIGSKRSGKGTISRVMQALVGRSSCCAPTLQSMGEAFGMQTWIGKKVAIVADARTSARNNSQAMVERVLTVTGEDTQYVNRKHIAPWEGRLRVRLWLLSNMLPTTMDKGAALVSRFLIIPHNVSFYGNEDTCLEETLADEHSGILNWAFAGLRRLQSRGYFIQPRSGEERIHDWEKINSPMLAFVQERCELGSGLFVEKYKLRQAYEVWLDNSQSKPSEAHFTEELKAATEAIVGTGQRNIDERKGVRVFTGIALKVVAKY